MFKTERKAFLDVTCSLEPYPNLRPHRLKVEGFPANSVPWEQRLLRDRWRLVERGFDPRTHRRVGQREIWEKPHPERPVKLCR